ncbi:MAG: hypothetical protein ACRDP9_27145 [Kribbellaceae bacterium]
MSSWISAIPAVESTRKLARSALPDAPVVLADRRPRADVRALVGRTLRSFASGGLRLAERIDSPRRYNTQPG